MIRLLAAAVTTVLAAFAPLTGQAAEEPLAIKWKELVPKGGKPAEPNRTFFSGVTPKTDDAAAPPPPMQEGKFMSLKRRQPGAGQPPSVVAELDGKRVSIGGYVVPLDFESTTIKEFLLVPFVGACIHVPPPPANQIIYVKVDSGLEITGQFDPVKVIGTLKTETAFTGLADAGYSITADTVEPMTP